MKALAHWFREAFMQPVTGFKREGGFISRHSVFIKRCLNSIQSLLKSGIVGTSKTLKPSAQQPYGMTPFNMLVTLCAVSPATHFYSLIGGALVAESREKIMRRSARMSRDVHSFYLEPAFRTGVQEFA